MKKSNCAGQNCVKPNYVEQSCVGQNYIERVCRDLSTRPSHQVAAEDHFLISVFEKVQDLPSPTKEEMFVNLLLEAPPIESAVAPAVAHALLKAMAA